MGFLSLAVKFLLGNLWRSAFLALLIAFSLQTLVAKHLLHQRDDARVALHASEVARAAAIKIWQGEIDRITGELADAKTAGQQAIADKARAELAAKADLARREKEWKGIYGAKPENRAWADSVLPADILERLRHDDQ